MDDALIKEDIIKTLLYFSIFNHALTLDELYYFHQKTNVTRQRINYDLRGIVSEKNGIIGELNGYYYIKPHMNHAVERFNRGKISHDRWKVAKRVSTIIKHFPFVRGIFITGSLGKNSSDVNSDIDYLIICKEKRLWIARTFLRLFVRILYNGNKLMCINYFLAENNLSIEDRNMFTATELALIKVMYNTENLNQLIQSNPWIEEYFPNYQSSNGRYHLPPSGLRTSDSRSMLQPLFEMFFPGKIGDKIDALLLRRIQRNFKKLFPDCAEREQQSSLVISAGTAKIHGTSIGDQKKRILEKYHDLLRHHGIFDQHGHEQTAKRDT
ncbi:MAG: hypothetical protein HXX11_01130 [Desulfuromonadales bacterium]|nr:hypothetical protein [Desulfuromonadales bacterium]